MSPIIFIIFLFFSFYDKVTNEPYGLYEIIKGFNVSCFPFDSCEAFTDLNKSDHLWNGRICECDSQCVRFGTCCADSKYVHEELPLSLPEHEHCEKLEYFPTPIIIVSRCNSSETWPSLSVQKCEENDYSSNDRLWTNIPLTSIKTNTTYKNSFCAECNNDEKNSVRWKVNLRTKSAGNQLAKDMEKYGVASVLKTIRYDPLSKHWIFLDKVKKKEIQVKVEYSLRRRLRHNVKPCYVGLVETCKFPFNGTPLEKKCKTYYSPVKVETQEGIFVYKNIHCAACNNANKFSCKISSCMRETSMRAEKFQCMSFAHLVNFNPNDGLKVGLVEVPNQDCGEDAVHDPYGKKCRKISCLPGRVWVNGKCVPQ